VVDGRYEIGCQHTWIRLPRGHILDVYSVGRHPPVALVAVVSTLPMRFEARDDGYAPPHRPEVVRALLDHLRAIDEAADRAAGFAAGPIRLRSIDDGARSWTPLKDDD